MLAKRWATQMFEGDAQALLSLLQEHDKTLSSKSVQEFTQEMRALTPNLQQHLFFSSGGSKDSPYYRIGGPKNTPDAYLDEIVPDLEEISAKVTAEVKKNPKGNPYLL